MTQSTRAQRGKVYFIGAGPGAADLITLRGKRRIDQAASVIYAGSLVNPELFHDYHGPLHDSSSLHLDEIVDLMVQGVENGGDVARVHTGDPSLYGAIREQMVRLDRLGIEYEIVPGVSSAFGAAAALRAELTLPGVTQSVIFTRREGRTPVPERERIARLATHGATMMIFLSVGMIADVAEELRAGGYSGATPVAVVARATWPDETVINGTLDDISAKVEAAGILKTAIICVGRVFGTPDEQKQSRLYDRTFSHGTRTAQEGKNDLE